MYMEGSEVNIMIQNAAGALKRYGRFESTFDSWEMNGRTKELRKCIIIACFDVSIARERNILLRARATTFWEVARYPPFALSLSFLPSIPLIHSQISSRFSIFLIQDRQARPNHINKK
jgi:hypothetical protein